MDQYEKFYAREVIIMAEGQKKLLKIIKVKKRTFTEDVLTVKEMMDMLAIGRNTAYRLLRDGTIASFRIGNTYRVLRKSVQSYIYNNGK